MIDEGRSRQNSIEDILSALIHDGSFTSAVVASKQGLPLATVGSTDTTLLAAVAASMKDLAERAHQSLTEITTRNESGEQIVIRYFTVDTDLLLLSVKMRAGRSYRRLTNRAIRKIQHVWEK